jgi:hypothetical protein
MWTLIPFNLDKQAEYETFLRKPENKGLELHLDALTDKTRITSQTQCRRNNKSEWKGYDDSLFATHRDEQGGLIGCNYKYATLPKKTKPNKNT